MQLEQILLDAHRGLGRGAAPGCGARCRAAATSTRPSRRSAGSATAWPATWSARCSTSNLHELITFLRKISIVELVCADLADALTDRHDGAEVLAQLASSTCSSRRSTDPDAGTGCTGCSPTYCAAGPAAHRERRDLERRAAEWFSQHAMPLQAISAAVAGELWPLAAQLVGTQLITLAMGGHAHDLERVLAAIPHTVLSAHPELAGGLAGARVVQGDPGDVADLLDAARAAAAGLGWRRAHRARTLVDLVAGALARLVGDWDATAAIYHRVLVDPHALARLGMAGAEMRAGHRAQRPRDRRAVGR